jgi:flap endonuclease-1
MGILGLRKLIRENAPDAIKTLPTEDLAGWKIGIDASIGIYELFYTGTRYNIIGTTKLPINHIQGTFHRTVKYLRKGMIPVFIFDGKPPEIKAGVIAARSEMKINGRGVKVPQHIFTDVIRLLQLMKIPYVQAPSEAEAQAARMCADGTLDAVATTDTDALTFGTVHQIIGLDGDSKFVTAITREHVLNGLNLTQAQFIDLCILLGCDYTTASLPGVGPKRSLKLIREHKSIEAIIAAEKIEPPAGFTYKEARAEFERPGVMAIDAKYALPKYTSEDISAIDKFLMDSGLTQSRYKRGLDELRKMM